MTYLYSQQKHTKYRGKGNRMKKKYVKTESERSSRCQNHSVQVYSRSKACTSLAG